MLPYALKIVWFTLSLSGMLSCWAVLCAFASTVRSYWLALVYCIGCTILQGVFCLGLIWRMDPFLMPRSFCITQAILAGFASYLLTGVCATFSMITNLAISSTGDRKTISFKIYAWHPSYILTLILFPLLSSMAHIAAVLKLDAVQPADGFVCDATSPEWVRFLSYAGMPLVFSIPFSYFGLMALIRMSRSQQRISQRYRNSTDHLNSMNLTSLPPKRTHRKNMNNFLGSRNTNTPTPIPTPRAIPSPSPSTVYPISPGRAPISPALSSPVFSTRQFHLPFSPLPTDDFHDPLGSCHSSTLEDHEDTDSFASSVFPVFASPSTPRTPHFPRESPPGHDFIGYLNRANPDYRRGSHSPAVHPQNLPRYSPTTGWESPGHDRDAHDDDDVSSIEWTRCASTRNDRQSSYVDAELDYVRTHGKNQYEYGKETANLDDDEEFETGVEEIQYTTRNMQLDANLFAMPSPFSNTGTSRRRIYPVSPLAGTFSAFENASIIQPALWRILIFQLSFTLILVLAGISTFIDIVSRRTRPTPFGTQHVAMLLAAWGPVFIFGSIPSTRRNLMFWKRSPVN
ncbi:hypothetical protein F5878DRAFT_434514 [Lentinula raphanica]|uniref:Uncharacterized protein n=1 Tax=Lentinula raphanica TaxID=153919 RepID=A0AA38PFF7_9AGAR|nr:hypothetical protein F5878DRAFT_434514 [Lentinula raphanica]